MKKTIVPAALSASGGTFCAEYFRFDTLDRSSWIGNLPKEQQESAYKKSLYRYNSDFYYKDWSINREIKELSFGEDDDAPTWQDLKRFCDRVETGVKISEYDKKNFTYCSTFTSIGEKFKSLGKKPRTLAKENENIWKDVYAKLPETIKTQINKFKRSADVTEKTKISDFQIWCVLQSLRDSKDSSVFTQANFCPFET